MRDELYRLSGTPIPSMRSLYVERIQLTTRIPGGTLRWQAPEVMSGQSPLTQQVDVYAFAMSCVEILTKGMVPWPLADDDAVRHFVTSE